MGWLDGDVALVTGAGSGLGRASVDRFVAQAARVVAVDRLAERAAAVDEAHAGVVLGVAADVTVPQDDQLTVPPALERFGVPQAGQLAANEQLPPPPAAEQRTRQTTHRAHPEQVRRTPNGSDRKRTVAA